MKDLSRLTSPTTRLDGRAFILAYVWTRHVEPRQNGDKLRATEIGNASRNACWGFVATFLIVFLIAPASQAYLELLSAAMTEAEI